MSPTVNSYNDEGNLTGKTGVSTGEVWSYGYDHRNQLVLAERKASSSDPVDLRVAFKYDAFGSRIEKSVDSDGDGMSYSPEILRFVRDGWNPAKPHPVGTENVDVLLDLDGSNALTTRYLRGDVVDQLFARVETVDDAYWYLTDRQGSIRHVLDDTGVVVKSLAYDGYGNITSETGAGDLGRYAYTGREFDVEIGMQYNRARYYDAATGRWTSQDPLGYDAGDSNLYRYVHNRPTGATDPSGLAPRITISTNVNGVGIQAKRFLGLGAGKTSILFGFKAVISFSSENELANSTITQEVVAITYAKYNVGGVVKYHSFLKDKNHPKGAFVSTEDANKVHQAWVANSAVEFLTLDTDGKTEINGSPIAILKRYPASEIRGNEFAFSDAPSVRNLNDLPKGFDHIYSYRTYKISVKWPDGPVVVAMFSVKLEATRGAGRWNLVKEKNTNITWPALPCSWK